MNNESFQSVLPIEMGHPIKGVRNILELRIEQSGHLDIEPSLIVKIVVKNWWEFKNFIVGLIEDHNARIEVVLAPIGATDKHKLPFRYI